MCSNDSFHLKQPISKLLIQQKKKMISSIPVNIALKYGLFDAKTTLWAVIDLLPTTSTMSQNSSCCLNTNKLLTKSLLCATSVNRKGWPSEDWLSCLWCDLFESNGDVWIRTLAIIWGNKKSQFIECPPYKIPEHFLQQLCHNRLRFPAFRVSYESMILSLVTRPGVKYRGRIQNPDG